MSFSTHKGGVLTPNTNFLNCIARLIGNPRAFDAYFDVIVCAFPHIGKTTGGNRVPTDSGEIAGNGVRQL